MKITQERKRIKIAEACGLEVIYEPRGPIDTRPSPYRLKRKVYYTPEAAAQRRKSWPRSMAVRVVPDYLNDLNAMHEAERVLDIEDGQWIIYSEHLERMTDDCGFHATAAQRAEAFGLTLGLWE